MEAVQPQLRPLSWGRRSGHHDRAPPDLVAQAGWSHQHQGAVHSDGLRRTAGQGHALLVRPGNGHPTIEKIYGYVKGRSDAKIGPGRPAVKTGT